MESRGGYTLFILLACVTIATCLVVDTHYGSVRGKQVTTTGPGDVPAYAFLGIPYAAPPVGDLRFGPPQPPRSWTGVKNFTSYGPMCPHNLARAQQAVTRRVNYPRFPYESIGQHEDCLSLNIFARPPTQGQSKAVMLFIHGGSFNIGTGAFMDGRVYATRHDVILVTINYRLAALGFLTTADGYVKGNMGLLDQVQALKWVKQNIAAFGGDPNRVTVFGESAGAMSVSFHVFSPASKGLFKRAIYQSDSLMNNNVAVSQQEGLQNAMQLAKYLGCSGSTKQVVACMRQQSIERIVYNVPAAINARMKWNPVIDGTAIPRRPTAMMEAGEFMKDVDVIAGVTNTEAFMFMEHEVPGFERLPLSVNNFTHLVIQHFSRFYKGTLPDKKLIQLAEAAKQVYIRNTTGDALKRHFVDFASDAIIIFPTFAAAVEHSKKGSGKTFFYEMDHRISSSVNPPYIIADHTDDLLFTFGWSANPDSPFPIEPKYNASDKQMDTTMPHYWANFAKTGDPNGDGLVKWEPFTASSTKYLKLQIPPTMGSNFNKARMEFWSQKLPAIAGVGRVTSATVSILMAVILAALFSFE